MKKSLFILFVGIVSLMLCILPVTNILATDQPSDWARESADEAVKLGLIPTGMQKEYTSGTTREEFCDTLILLINKENVAFSDNAELGVFEDTTNENIAKLHSLEIVTGVSEGLFNPAGLITRQEAATMLTRAAKVLGKVQNYEKASFSDIAAIADWASDNIDYVAGSGLMGGTGSGFEPLGIYTHEQTIVTMLRLYKFINTPEIPKPSKKDLDSAWDLVSASISLEGTKISIEGEGASSDGSRAVITAEGTYLVSGNLTDGQIMIDAEKNADVRLVLNGVNITNKTGAPIYAASCDKLIVILADGTQNILTDGGDRFIYADEEEEPNAALFCKDDLTINGGGGLTVNAGFNNGIGTKDDLVIMNGNFEINAVNHGIIGRDSVSVYGGSFNINAGSDGIQSSNTGGADKGWIYIADGSFDITSAKDGIQAETDFTIEKGIFNVMTGGGAMAAPPVSEFGFGGRGGQFPNDGFMPQDDRMPRGDEMRPNERGGRQPEILSEPTESMKGIKSKGNLFINGGIFNIDAEDDAFHSNKNLTVTDGNITIKTGDDGFHADSSLTITGGVILIESSYEGLEGATVDISGGNINITASDDGINAAGGTDTTFGNRRQGMDSFSSSGGSRYIRISGGILDICGGADGIDSNGNIYFEGGKVSISGRSMGMDGAIDADGAIIVTGGSLVTAGSTMPLNQASTQAGLIVNYTTQNAAGDLITLKDSAGNTVLEYKSRMAFTASCFSDPSLSVGGTYSICINGEKRFEVQMTELITSVSEDGSPYSFGGRGGMGGGREPRPNGMENDFPRQRP